MKTPIRILAMFFGLLLIVAGSDQAFASAFGPPSADSVRIDLSSTSVGTNSTATLTATVTRRNGTPETDGTILSATVSPPTMGTVAGVGTGGTASGSTSPLIGGVASFVFIAGNTPGTATVTISLPPSNGYPNTVSVRTQITIVQGTGNNPSLQVSLATAAFPQPPVDPSNSNPPTATLPQNLLGVGPYEGSPYMAELKVQWRGLITGQPINGKINVAASPVGFISFSMLDDPTTPWPDHTKPDGNEFLTLLGSGQVPVTAGVGTIFVHAGSSVGTGTLTISAVDPETNRTISSQVTIAVVTPPGANIPVAIVLSQSSGGVYINGSNGTQSKSIGATVSNIFGTPAVAAPGKNNVLFEIVGPAGTDARLFGVSATGFPQVGSSVYTTTGGGAATVYFFAGSRQGPVQIRATTDGWDGDVGDVGDVNRTAINLPLTAMTTVVVSDGQLYSLTITSPVVNALAVNGVTPSGSNGNGGGQSGGLTIPLKPDATYSVTVSAIATDRQGNPVIPGTPIRFGLIDTPQTNDFSSPCGLGPFQICGIKGSPIPGQPIFSAPDGQFGIAGGGAGPGDTLVVFGKQAHGAPAGNDDLESAMSIAGVFGNTQLGTWFPFNLNDTTGTSTTPSPLPYVIGRATIGNIGPSAATDSNGNTTITGVATTTLNYPVSQLGKGVVIWAQGTGTDPLAPAGKQTRLVTDAIVRDYPPAASVQIQVSPDPIPGNVTSQVQACLVDALSVPVPGVQFHFSFGNLGVGTGKVNNVEGSGDVLDAQGNPVLTDSSGCVLVSVFTTGLSGSSGGSSSGTPNLAFSVGRGVAPKVTNINVSGGPLLVAAPSALGGSGGTVTLSLLNSDGSPIPGVQLTASCDAKISLQSVPAKTDDHGSTTAIIVANPGLDAYKTPGSGKCTFTTSTGSPSVTVNLQGTDLCIGDPTNALCGFQYTVAVSLLSSAGNAYGSITSSPGGLSCAMTADTSTGTPPVVTAVHPTSCSAQYPTGTAVTITATVTKGTGVTWAGDCAANAKNLTTSVSMNSAKNCTATFNP